MKLIALMLCVASCGADGVTPAVARGEPAKASSGAGPAKAASAAATTVTDEPHPMPSLVNINTAEMAALRNLEGINLDRAQAIVADRPYTSTDELVARSILPQSVFAKIKARLTVKTVPTAGTPAPTPERSPAPSSSRTGR